MKIQKTSKQSSKTKKKLLFLSVIILIILVFILVLWLIYRKNPNNHQSTTPAEITTSSVDTNRENKDVPKEKPTRESEKEPLQTVENPPLQTNVIPGVISHKSINGDQLILRTTIDQNLSSGSCILTMKNGDKTITKSAEIIQNPTSSSCMGFDIPVSELSPGTWNINIIIKNNSLTGEIIDTITI